jgi:plasmid stabilization system protein ParE
MTIRASVYATRNFERNLESIRLYLEERDKTEHPEAFDRLLELLFDTVIPNLEEFPRLGFDFLARTPQSVEGVLKLRAIQARLGEGTTIREYIIGDDIVLYAASSDRVDLLAIKHHKQLSFDLKGHWRR